MKKLLYILTGCLAFAVGYGVIAKAAYSYPYGLSEYHGYFTNTPDTSGTYVLDNVYSGEAFPSSVNSASSFTNFIISQLSSNSQQKTGASFIIQTMIGASKNRPPTAGEQSTWVTRVNEYAAAGKVKWSTSFCYSMNTYYQGPRGGGTTNDDAFFEDSGCDTAIVFYNSNGSTYAIKRHCANPVGQPSAISGLSNWTMSGRSTVDDSTPTPGQKITFNHYVKDQGPTSTNGQHIWYEPLDYPSGAPWVGGQDSGAYNAGEEKMVIAHSQTVPANATPGTQICEYIFFDHAAWNVVVGGDGPPVCATVQGPAATCVGIVVTPSPLDPSDPYTLTATVKMPGGLATAKTIDAVDNFFIKINGPNVNFSNNNVTTTKGTIGTYGSISATVSPGPTNSAGTYTVTYGLTGPTSAKSCSGSFAVAYSPYFSVQGGDVAAGPDFGTACTSGVGSGIKGLNLESGGNYYGAGSQMGALALGSIVDFATNTTLDTSAGTASSTIGSPIVQRPSALAFSNSGISSTVWGTNFGKDPTDDPADNPSWCVPDYVGTASSATPAPTQLGTTTYTLDQTALNGLTSGKTYVVNGTATLSGSLVFGKTTSPTSPARITLIVNGDAILANGAAGITYAPYSYVSGTTDPASIPQFQLLVKGNIYIGKQVQSLFGFYAAQPSGGSGGTIYTCANAAKYITGVSGDANANATVSVATYYTDCDDPLTITGSVAAKSIKLGRTGGNLTQTGSIGDDPAETIVYPPELWMANIKNISAGIQPYDAITSLPPIL